ncbi:MULTISPECIES: GNAT family N-acetyltransferase [unclassified Enterococcus]|uniref:GNAT family N-acetyltransferase n=1 Tax=unclassified Enterococcus TaxID=2608891 RepID=UPI001556F55C|nr:MULTISPECIES: GNAT family N-acetyltransferase [unclassified Enterococcus]MBS7576801.1 GNAT family N-acetyltransferase [Enterococcus sp. MMGLQ5-2]MBS7584208.1 GNAT family N-acetyltransferase [Enterococcus sp. MMGLQ5-1]NPD12064.1 GNAT family N-acetyltransferase [Enterococcus sp. MMGLQ5-1]NPD36636.1 GNAT family N-acetyltransferase [Enterococcus sp. MMGLQ5-2]
MNDLIIREAIPTDAKQLLAVLKRIGGESEFLTMDENGVDISEADEALALAAIYESPNNTLMVALVDDEIVGTVSISGDSHYRIFHIGELGISILSEYQGYGIGGYLMDAVIDWAIESKVIKRLELTVQKRNKKAVQLYLRKGFRIEGEQLRGARLQSGEYIEVLSMSRLID